MKFYSKYINPRSVFNLIWVPFAMFRWQPELTSELCVRQMACTIYVFLVFACFRCAASIQPVAVFSSNTFILPPRSITISLSLSLVHLSAIQTYYVENINRVTKMYLQRGEGACFLNLIQHYPFYLCFGSRSNQAETIWYSYYGVDNYIRTNSTEKHTLTHMLGPNQRKYGLNTKSMHRP